MVNSEPFRGSASSATRIFLEDLLPEGSPSRGVIECIIRPGGGRPGLRGGLSDRLGGVFRAVGSRAVNQGIAAGESAYIGFHGVASTLG